MFYVDQSSDLIYSMWAHFYPPQTPWPVSIVIPLLSRISPHRRWLPRVKESKAYMFLEDVSPSPGISINQVAASTWHSRLGHPSTKVLHSLHSHLYIDTSASDNKTPCYVCSLAKQRRLPFVSHHTVTTCAFELIYCDIWGSYHVPTHNNQKYFLTLVDDCTRCTWIFLIQHKCESLNVVSRFCTLIETQFHKKIKVFRTDNAKELAFTDLFQRGLFNQFSCVHTPQQNS